MLRIIITSAILCASPFAISAQSFAAEQNEVKLSKKERKALKKKNAKLGKMSSMCIGALAMSTLKDSTIRETPKFKASESFWLANLNDATSHAKSKKKEKLKDTYRTQGSAALENFGDGNIIVGGKKASSICTMIESEGLNGPTANMMLK